MRYRRDYDDPQPAVPTTFAHSVLCGTHRRTAVGGRGRQDGHRGGVMGERTNLERVREESSRFAHNGCARDVREIPLCSPRVPTLCPHSLTIRTPALPQFVLLLGWGVAKW
jgi:hypothetical protein